MRDLSGVVVTVCLLGAIGLPGCAPPRHATPVAVSPAAAPAPSPLPPSADGIAFIRDGRAFVVRDGAAREVAANGAEKSEVAYSADGKEILVTEARGARRVVRMTGVGARAPGPVVLESSDGSNLGPVRAVAAKGRLYHAIFGGQVNRLVISGLTPGSKSSTVALRGTFSGEFDVDAAGDSVVYTGTGQNPATVMLRTGVAERPLVAGLATAFTPSFSGDGARICMTGSERADGPLSVYVVGEDSGEPRVVAGTEGLTPTSPVFSPDGASIAFLSATDGTIWVVPAIGGTPQQLALTADEAPISW